MIAIHSMNAFKMSTKGGWTNRRLPMLAFMLIMFIGSILRVYEIGTESIWFDEASSINLSARDITEIITKSGPTQNHPPFYFLILHYWMSLFGTAEVATRSLSAIFGILSIFLIYQVGMLLFNPKVGLLSGFLSAISTYHIHYSQETRSYSLLLLLSLLSYLFFIKILKEDRKWDSPCYFLTNILLGYTHFYGLLIIASQVFFFALFWGGYRLKRIKFSIMVVGTWVTFLPLGFILGKRAGNLIMDGFWIPEPRLQSIKHTLIDFSGFGSGGKYILLMSFILILLGLFSFTRPEGTRVWKNPFKSMKNITQRIKFDSVEEHCLLALWLFFSIIIPYIESKLMTPIYHTRYMIGASPAFLLLVAKGIANIPKKSMMYPIIAMIVLLSIPGLRLYYVNDTKPQWREVATFIKIHSKVDSDVAIFFPSYEQEPFSYYYKGELKTVGVKKRLVGTQEMATWVDNAVQGKNRLWLILTYSDKNAEFMGYWKNRYENKAVQLKKQFAGVYVFLLDVFLLDLSSP